MAKPARPAAMPSQAWISARFGLGGRGALVTGGGSGVGLAMAEALGRAGASLVLAGRTEHKLGQAAAQLGGMGITASYVVAELAEAAGIERCARAATEQLGHVDILVNAAGFNLREPFLRVSRENWERHLAVHVGAPFFLTQKLAPAMKERSWGRIINLASLQSQRAFPDSAPYGAAKGGVVQLTRAIAEEWSRFGITCNAVAPGFFPSALTAPVLCDPAQAAMQAARTMIGRNGHPDDLHGVTVFLAGEAAAYITGQVVYVDGGYTAK